ncbi:hypothetical protein BV25DRAFT_1773499, partial [Artomyces pyxidatus]
RKCHNRNTIHNVTSHKERCETILDYCSSRVARSIRTLQHYHVPNWDELKKSLLDHFDADRATKRYNVKDLTSFVERQQRKHITSMPAFKTFDMNYRAIAGELRQRKKIDENQLNMYYWLAIGLSLRNQIEHKILKDDPTLTLDDPFPMDLIYNAAVKILARDRFDSHTFIDRNREESEDASSSDSEDERRRRARRRTRRKSEKKNKKSVKFSSEIESESERYLRETAKQRLPPRNKETTSQEEIEDLIKQLGQMKLTDSNYGITYYRALKLDADIGKVVKAPLTVTPSLPIAAHSPSPVPMKRDPPPHLSLTEPTRTYVPAPRREEMVCFGCGEKGHGLSNCAKLAELVTRGEVARDTSGRIAYLDGSRIRRIGDESILAVVERERPLRTRTTFMASESESESDLEEDNDEHGPSARVWPAERIPKSLGKGRKLVFDGVYPPPRRGQSQEKPKAREVERDREAFGNVPPPKAQKPIMTHPAAYDGQDSDTIMEDTQTQSKGKNNKENVPVSGRKRENRKTALSAAVDPTKVLGRMLSTPVTMAWGDIIGTSAELSGMLSESLKQKSSPIPTTVTMTAFKVPTLTHGTLIRVTFECNGIEVPAIVDTGSEINIVSLHSYKNVIRAPLDIRRTVRLGNANGGSKMLRGLVSEVMLRTGGVETPANFFVGESAPFTMLLGRPWQRGNYVSIDERTDGTYLVF